MTFLSPEYVILLTRLEPMFVKKKLLNALAISSVFVVSLLFILKDSGKHFLLFFLEIISFIVFHMFLMSNLYLAKVDAK